LAVAGLLVGPAIAQQSTLLSTALPKASGDLIKSLQQSPFGASAIEGMKRAMDASSANNWQSTIKFAGLTAHGLGGLFFAVALGVFMSYQPNLYRNGLISLFPKERRDRIGQVLNELDFTLWWWLMGQLITMASVGTLIGIGLTVLGVPLSGTLGLMAAVLAFIPSLGPLISVIPALILGFSISPATGFWVIGLYAAVQFLEANVISPLVQLKAISLPPALILGSELIMGILFGGSGLAVATPLAATCLVLVNMLYIQDVLGDRGSLPSDVRKQKKKEQEPAK
jgi:predicted PurR-regulated permease PerM